MLVYDDSVLLAVLCCHVWPLEVRHAALQDAEGERGTQITMCRIGNPEWNERSIWDDDYQHEEDELSPLDDDYVREGYESEEW